MKSWPRPEPLLTWTKGPALGGGVVHAFNPPKFWSRAVAFLTQKASPLGPRASRCHKQPLARQVIQQKNKNSVFICRDQRYQFAMEAIAIL